MTPPSRVDRYEILRELGHGGMAVVYEGRHAELGSRHAIKVFAAGSPRLAERLLHEGRLQARLTHPHVVAVTDTLTVDDRPALVLEFVDGLTLEEWIARHPDAPDAVRRRLAGQILEAVRHAHAHGTIHRDLKPSNVLVSGPPDEPWAKVADFGLAKCLDDEVGGGTKTGVPMGTPRYMAPEQIRDAKHVDERADVFALGCLLAELWSGRPVFEGEGMAAVFERIAKGRFEVPPEAPPDVARAVAAALRPDRTQRPQSVDELIRMLDAGRTVSVPAVAPPAKKRRFGAVLWLAPLVALVVVGIALGSLLTCAGLGVAGLGGAEAPAEARPPKPARTRPRHEPIQAPAPKAAPAPAPAPAPSDKELKEEEKRRKEEEKRDDD